MSALVAAPLTALGAALKASLMIAEPVLLTVAAVTSSWVEHAWVIIQIEYKKSSGLK